VKKLTFLIIMIVAVATILWSQVPDVAVPDTRENQPQPKTDIPVTPAPEMSAADIEAFLEGIVPLQLQRDNIAGATIAVVKDGKLLFSKGYGYADREKKTPVSPADTLFRPGSVSKLFTWTAVMQLHEQGKLDLDKDVNEYLDFKIPEAYGKPITLKNIMTHTPGFNEAVKDLFVTGTESPNLGEYLKTHIPARIYPPGTTPSYSNYGTALAGYIVERVSGVPFDQYVDQNIFKPLGMTNSTFAQPLPASLAGKMSNGYRLASGQPVPFEMVTAYPAGSLSSTAEDMAKFMLAHLQEGKFGDGQILRPETARLMHSRLFGLDDAANAMCYGFYEESRNGHRIIGHGGDTIAFHSDLHLVPDTGVGFFVSYNSLGKGEVSGRSMLWEAFLDRYFPYKAEPTVLETAKDDAKKVTGNYMVSRRSDTSFIRAASVLGEAKVAAAEDGKIIVDALTEPTGEPKKWQEVAPMTFQDVNGQDKLVFKPDYNGAMQMILPFPFMVFKRVGFWENSSLILPVLGLSLGIMALTLLLTPVAWLVRRHYGRKLELNTTERLLRWGTWVVFALDLICIVGLTSLITYALNHIEMLSDSKKFLFMIFQAIGIIGAIGTLVVLYSAINAWMSDRFRIWGKLQATILFLACLGFLWFAFVGNLLIFRSNY
jgi:CubicO group peptidase (beta-lactamase class C family)